MAYYSEEWINGLIAVNVWTFNFVAVFRELAVHNFVVNLALSLSRFQAAVFRV